MKQFVLSLLVSCVVLVFVSCTKSSVSGNVSPTYLQMVNTCYEQSFSLIVGSNTLLSNIGYDSVSLFANGTPGFYSRNVTNASGATVLTGNINLQSGLYYSLFLVPDSTQGSDSVLHSLITSTRVQPQYDSAKIQFLNYAYNLPPVNFCLVPKYGNAITDTIGGLRSPNPIYQSRTYMDINSTPALAQFQTIPTNTYDIIFYPYAGTLQPYFDTTVTLSKGALYTIYMEGNYASQNADSMKVRFIQQ
jgi:hypothetical protein